MTPRIAEDEAFCFRKIKVALPQSLDSALDNGPFLLSHTDLRETNIIVDDELNITGIIDWEWSAVIPRQLFMPPTWIAGEEPGLVVGRFIACKLLAGEWTEDLAGKVAPTLAVVLKHQGSTFGAFYGGILPRMFLGRTRAEVLGELKGERGDGGEE